MTGPVVNLRRVRKGKARLEAAGKAAENRAFFGQTRAARDAKTVEDAIASKRLDGHRRDPSPSDR